MSSVLEKPVMQESRHYAPTVRSAVAVAAALLAVFCLLYGLSFPGFPLWAAGWGVIAAATSATLVVASGIRAVVTGRSRGRSALMLVLVTPSSRPVWWLRSRTTGHGWLTGGLPPGSVRE